MCWTCTIQDTAPCCWMSLTSFMLWLPEIWRQVPTNGTRFTFLSELFITLQSSGWVKSIQNHERLLPRCCWRQWRRGREVLSKSLSVGQWCYSLNKYRLILSLTRKSRILVWSVLKKSRSSHLCDHKGLGISQQARCGKSGSDPDRNTARHIVNRPSGPCLQSCKSLRVCPACQVAEQARFGQNQQTITGLHCLPGSNMDGNALLAR